MIPGYSFLPYSYDWFSLFLTHVFPPCIVLAVLQVVHVGLMAVGFPLEGDAEVGVATAAQFHHPFSQIPQVEEDDPHLQDLRRVDTLMIDQPLREIHVVMAEEHTAEIDGGKMREGYVFVAHDDHQCKDRQNSGIMCQSGKEFLNNNRRHLCEDRNQSPRSVVDRALLYNDGPGR